MQTFITPDDLVVFDPTIDKAKAQAMIDDAVAMACKIAPCIKSDTFEDVAAVRAVLRRAILRWHESGAAGSRVTVNRQAGQFGQTETESASASRGLFWPAEINDLQDLCSVQKSSKAFSIDTASVPYGNHSPWCSLLMSNGTFPCSCGAYLFGYPAFEEDAAPTPTTLLPWILPVTF